MVWINKRDATLCLDHLHGVTFSELAVKNGIHISRTHQIFKRTMFLLQMDYMSTTAAEFGLEIQRKHRAHRWNSSTPEGFYYVVSQERREDGFANYKS
jgi:hypothetical protein